jgi:hypothetical protein
LNALAADVLHRIGDHADRRRHLDLAARQITAAARAAAAVSPAREQPAQRSVPIRSVAARAKNCLREKKVFIRDRF